MVFSNFRFHIILRVVILFASVTVLAWCLVNQLYLRSAYLGVGTVILLVELIWFIERFNRDIKNFMTSLQQGDFTTRYQSRGKGKSLDELYHVLNQITAAFKKISTEKEIQYLYLEMLVEHVRVSIMSIDAEGKIHLANQAVKDLLQKNVLTSLQALESLDKVLVKTIRELHSGETRLIKLRVNNDVLQLSIHASEFRLENRYYKLISMQNIRNELDSRELEAWQKLIRVLSHEIMNSVAPIISLSDTLHGLVTGNQHAVSNMDQYLALDKGLEAIKVRSEGLYNFTQSYRKLTGIHSLSLQQTNLKELMERVRVLMQPKLDQFGIPLMVSDVDVGLNVDPGLMEQVLINLLLNAMEAVSGKPDPCITVRISVTTKGNRCIHITDNGEGIEETMLDKIFIPFFTTRKNGSGIGLAITKQILQLHQAAIRVNSQRGEGTEFTIVL